MRCAPPDTFARFRERRFRRERFPPFLAVVIGCAVHRMRSCVSIAIVLLGRAVLSPYYGAIWFGVIALFVACGLFFFWRASVEKRKWPKKEASATKTERP